MKELLEIQKKLKAPKDSYNAYGKYKYRSAESILESVKPLLVEQGCTLVIYDDIVPVLDRIYVKATAVLRNGKGDMESVTAFAREEESKKGMDASQVTGAASSYARKYALNGLFCIDDTKDADALNNNPQYTQQKAAPSPQQEAMAAVTSCKSIDELTEVWKRYTSLHANIDFKTAVADKGTSLKQAS